MADDKIKYTSKKRSNFYNKIPDRDINAQINQINLKVADERRAYFHHIHYQKK